MRELIHTGGGGGHAQGYQSDFLSLALLKKKKINSSPLIVKPP